MNQMDFTIFHIDNFTPREVCKTGADLKDVQIETMVALQKFREMIARRVGLIFNGMTTGGHKAKEHPGGLAVDGFLYIADGAVNSYILVVYALLSGFRGIGVYYNYETKSYSFHLDLRRRRFSFWIGYKLKTEDKWTFRKMLLDPKIVLKKPA